MQDRLAGSRTGIFVGITSHDYSQVLSDAQPDAIDTYYITGSSLNAAAGRLSFTLGFQVLHVFGTWNGTEFTRTDS